jgi:hypothetical protein
MDKEGKRSCSLLQAEQHMLDFMEGRSLFIHSNHALVVTYNAQLLASFSFDITNDSGVKRVERA